MAKKRIAPRLLGNSRSVLFGPAIGAVPGGQRKNGAATFECDGRHMEEGRDVTTGLLSQEQEEGRRGTPESTRGWRQRGLCGGPRGP